MKRLWLVGLTFGALVTIVTLVISAQGPPGATRSGAFEGTRTAGPNFIADATSGPPLQVASTTLVPNLNAALLNGRSSFVTSITAGPGLAGGTITGSGTLSLATGDVIGTLNGNTVQ